MSTAKLHVSHNIRAVICSPRTYVCSVKYKVLAKTMHFSLFALPYDLPCAALLADDAASKA